MSQENVEASRQVWERFLVGDTPGVLACLDSNVEVYDPPDLPGAGVYHGHAGWTKQITKFREAFDQFDYKVLEHIDCGESVVTVVEASATGTGSGISGTVTYAQVETWRDDKVVSIRYFTGKQTALEAVGLSE
jgi:ketosteroid isomerase-like protein